MFVLAFYWLVERASIKRVILRTVPPQRARDVNTVWMEVEEKLGGWVRGQLILMLAIGVMATIGYFVLGLPNPILLGVVAGLFEIVPMVGPFLAFAPAVLVALADRPDPGAGRGRSSRWSSSRSRATCWCRASWAAPSASAR